MMTRYSIFLAFICILFQSQLSFSQEKYNYEYLKSLKYSDLSSQQKAYFKSELIRRFSSDPEVIAVRKLKAHLADQVVKAAVNRSPAERAKLKEAGTGMMPVDQMRLMGVANPEKYVEDMKLVMTKMMNISMNYPELSKFDKEFRKQIFEDAMKDKSKPLSL
jgi:hypothetical protein